MMKLRVILLLLLAHKLHGQTFHGAPFQGMGNTGLALESIYSLTNNPAGIANLSQTEIAIAYHPHFMSSELRSQAVYLAVPLKRLDVIGFSVNNDGIIGTSSLLTAKMAYVRRFGESLSTSFTGNYHRFYVKGYQSDTQFSADLGVLWTVNDMLKVGTHFRNISLAKYADNIEQYIPQEFGIGAQYRFSKELTVTTDAVYESVEKMSYRAGFAYAIDHRVVFRAGAASGPTQYFAGLGLMMNAFHIDLSSSFHSRLGSSPQIALRYAF